MPVNLFFKTLQNSVFFYAPFKINVISLDFRFFFSIFASLINKFLTILYCLF